MYGKTLQVYGEDLAVGAMTANFAGSDPVLAGGTMGALTANVFADDAVKVGTGAKVSITASPTKDGSYTEVAAKNLTAGNYSAGDLIATIALPFDMDMWAKASVTVGSGSSGNVTVTLGYLPR